jgi:hypothetical protein
MVSKRRRLAVLAVVVVVIVASLAIVAIELTKGPTEAEQIILSPKDIGDGWLAVGKTPINAQAFENETSLSIRQVQNASIGIDLIVYVFASRNDSVAAFIELNGSIRNSAYYSNFSFTPSVLGDLLFYFDHDGYPEALLLVGRTLTILATDQENFALEHWYKNAFVMIATLQAEKIDHYLAR